MTEHVRAAIIGGGVVGVSTLLHLAMKGWTDTVLLERKELSSGSTWHAAGLLPLFNMSYSVGRLHQYSVDFYRELAAEAETDIGLRILGNIRMAQTPDRMDEFLQYTGVARTIGVHVDVLSPAEIVEYWPLCVPDGLVGGIRHPDDGYVQPADLVQAMARKARALGARIRRGIEVTAIERTGSGEWRLTLGDGEDIIAEHIISCTGNFARRTGAMVGLDLPVIPVEHQYIVTESHPAIEERLRAGLPELGVLREADGSWYMRQEGSGLLLGPYEKDAPCCYLDGPHPDSEYELFQEDLDRLAPHIESAIARVPVFAEAGVKKVYNGAICYTPDGAPIVGPAWGLPNFWLNEGHSFGVTAAGGAGWQLAEWIVEGEPTIDMLGVDPRRYGAYTTKPYLRRKNEEAYAHLFKIHYPDEERPAARPLRMAPCHERLRERGAVFGQKFGWERANWFAPPGVAQEDHWSFRHASWFEPVGRECRHVAEHVGLLDMTAFAKARVSGPGALSFLEHLVANTLPRKDGRVHLCHALNNKGGVLCEFTILREREDSFYLVSAGAWQRLDHDWLTRHMPDDGSVRMQPINGAMGVLAIAGPRARSLLQRVSDADFSNEAFPWLSARNITIGLAPCLAVRVNFVGELGWELHHDLEYQNHIFDALMEAGEDLKLRPFGIRAMNSLRLEKSYRLIGTELSIEYSALESGLDRFVRFNKEAFIGRDALLRQRERGLTQKLVTLAIDTGGKLDAWGDNPVLIDDRMVGRTTSGGFGWRVNRSLAMAMIGADSTKTGTKFGVEILGERYGAQIVEESPYDPSNEKLRN